VIAYFCGAGTDHPEPQGLGELTRINGPHMVVVVQVKGPMKMKGPTKVKRPTEVNFKHGSSKKNFNYFARELIPRCPTFRVMPPLL